jgi:hypothetical protein
MERKAFLMLALGGTARIAVDFWDDWLNYTVPTVLPALVVLTNLQKADNCLAEILAKAEVSLSFNSRSDRNHPNFLTLQAADNAGKGLGFSPPKHSQDSILSWQKFLLKYYAYVLKGGTLSILELTDKSVKITAQRQMVMHFPECANLREKDPDHTEERFFLKFFLLRYTLVKAADKTDVEELFSKTFMPKNDVYVHSEFLIYIGAVQLLFLENKLITDEISDRKKAEIVTAGFSATMKKFSVVLSQSVVIGGFEPFLDKITSHAEVLREAAPALTMAHADGR